MRDQRKLYFCLSVALSSLLFYTYYTRLGGSGYEDIVSRLNLHHATSDATIDSEPFIPGQESYLVLANGSRVRDNLYDVHNETLGVQEVFMLGLPERRDKRDAFAVQAELSRFKYTQVDGVKPSEVAENSLPYTMDMDGKSVACWRAHMNILETMVERRVRSIMVFEDDADWDVAFKHQLVQFARGSRFLLDTPSDALPFSPYGDGWDLLWIGHCGTTDDAADPRRWVIPDDPTAVPRGFRDEFVQPNMSTWEDGTTNLSTRIVHVGGGNICTSGYIISLRGAEKLLYHMSMQPYSQPVDIGMGIVCTLRSSNFTCISPFPTIVGVSKPAGDSARWSDLGHVPEEPIVDEKGHSERLSFSTRQNLDRLLIGQDLFESRFPDVYPEMSLAEIARGVGHPEWIDVWLPPELVTETSIPQDNETSAAENAENTENAENAENAETSITDSTETPNAENADTSTTDRVD